jgi:hypothetical protein
MLVLNEIPLEDLGVLCHEGAFLCDTLLLQEVGLLEADVMFLTFCGYV